MKRGPKRLFKDGKFYHVDLTRNGVRHHFSTKQKDFDKASLVLADFIRDLENGEVGIKKRVAPITLAQAGEAFLASRRDLVRQGSRRAGTILFHKKNFGLLEKHFGPEAPLEGITAEKIEAFRRSRLEKVKLATTSRELASLKAASRYAVTQGKLVKTAFDYGAVTIPSSQPRTRRLSFAEENSYLMACSPTMRDAYMILADLGIRHGELRHLQVADVDLHKGSLLICVSKTDAGKRTLHLTKETRAIVSRRAKAATANGGTFLFPRRVGRHHDFTRPVRSLKGPHAQALKASGVAHFRLHDIRRTAASRMLASGSKLKEVSDALGHSRIATTDLYLALDSREQKGVSTRMDSYRAKEIIRLAEQTNPQSMRTTQ